MAGYMLGTVACMDTGILQADIQISQWAVCAAAVPKPSDLSSFAHETRGELENIMSSRYRFLQPD